MKSNFFEFSFFRNIFCPTMYRVISEGGLENNHFGCTTPRGKIILTIFFHSLYSRLSRQSRGSSAGLVTVGPIKVQACVRNCHISLSRSGMQ